MTVRRAAIFLSLQGLVTATSNGDLASWYAARALVDQLADMQPDVVARLLGQVEQKWEEMALADLRNKTQPGTSLASMKDSCGKVSKAIVKGSEGDKDRVALYLQDVCKTASAENVLMCQNFASVLGGHLSHDAYSNREELDTAEFCTDFYNGAVKQNVKSQAAALDAADKAAQEKAKVEAQAKAKADEDAAKAQAHAAQEARKVEADRLANEAVRELDQATDKISQAKQAITQVEKRADVINQESKNATDTADQARKEVEVAAEKEAQAAEKQAAEAQERVKALRVKKEEEQKAKVEAQNMDDKQKAGDAMLEGKSQDPVAKSAALLKKSSKANVMHKKLLRAEK